MFLCTSEDDYVRSLQYEHRQAIWRAQLSSGLEVFLDDGRPGAHPVSAWERLGLYCQQEGVHLIGLGLQFRSNRKVDVLPLHADGYYFSRTALAALNSPDTLHFMRIGFLQNGILRVQLWSVPELILIEVEDRDPKGAGPHLIRRTDLGQEAQLGAGPH